MQAPETRKFVIQKHAASRLHYDFRLEMSGVLKSWAVPKGLPARRGQKALAIEVEDHPLEYGSFEGVIPEGNYGAGSVMVWDRGDYTVAGASPEAAYHQGKIHFGLAGEKCRGEWTLVRFKDNSSGDKKNWLLIKNRDFPAAASRIGAEQSVLTGRTMEEIAAGRPRTRARKPASAKTAHPADDPPPLPGDGFIEPMKALGVEEIPDGSWRSEVKFDGYRAIAVLHDGRARLWSRNHRSLAEDYPEIVEAIRQLPCRNAVLDGEVVALDQDGISRFQLLQQRDLRGERPPIYYYIFDLLHLDSESLLSAPIEERQRRLAKLLDTPAAELRLSPVFTVEPADLLQAVRRKGLEGIVAKASGSTYEPGRRSGRWTKCRVTAEQEFVIGGFTPPRGGRSHFGALLVGFYAEKKLLYAGKVGTGFDEARLASLHRAFQSRIVHQCPFSNLPMKRQSHGQAMTAAAMKKVTWVRPELICQVRFAEWTEDRLLRQPVFLGLRQDKDATEVVREATPARPRKRTRSRWKIEIPTENTS